LHELAKLPTYAHDGDSGMDICSVEDIIIPAGEWKMVHTGVAVDIPYGYEIQARSRSGLASKHGVFVLNGIGTIDSTFKGELITPLANFSKVDFVVTVGMRIMQLVLAKVEYAKPEIVSCLSKSDRGENGWGSTGLM